MGFEFFFGILLEFFQDFPWVLSFLELEFFSKCPKKSLKNHTLYHPSKLWKAEQNGTELVTLPGRPGGEGLTANDKTLPRFAVTPIPIEGLENLRCLQLQQDFLQQATGYDREKRKRTSRFDPYSTISIHFPQTSKTRFYNLHGHEMCEGVRSADV